MPARADSMTPKEQHHAAKDHLHRGLAIAKVLQALVWQVECQWDTSEPFTLDDLDPCDLRIVYNRVHSD